MMARVNMNNVKFLSDLINSKYLSHLEKILPFLHSKKDKFKKMIPRDYLENVVAVRHEQCRDCACQDIFASEKKGKSIRCSKPRLEHQ